MVENAPETRARAALWQRDMREIRRPISPWLFRSEIYCLTALLHSMRMPVRKVKGKLG
jgi:hypothetical protein